MFDAGMQFWYVLMSSKNFSGLYCMGINTRDGECVDAKMSIGSAADSMYEYMLKQWILSGHTQQVRHSLQQRWLNRTHCSALPAVSAAIAVLPMPQCPVLLHHLF
jgi:hypothetical protein